VSESRRAAGGAAKRIAESILGRRPARPDFESTIQVADGDSAEIVRSGYDALGGRYLAWAESITDNPQAEYVAELLEHLPEHPEVLDLGCGPGSEATALLAGVGRLTGVDLSARQLAQARARVPAASFLETDLRTVSFPPESFDAVLALFSLIHVPPIDLPAVLGSVGRWLRPGGRFLATFAVCPMEGAVQADWLGVPTYFAREEQPHLIAMIEDAGLAMERADLRTQDEGEEGIATLLWVLAGKP